MRYLPDMFPVVRGQDYIAVNENFRKAVTSALLEYERTKTVNRDKMSMN